MFCFVVTCEKCFFFYLGWTSFLQQKVSTVVEDEQGEGSAQMKRIIKEPVCKNNVDRVLKTFVKNNSW